MKVAILGLGAMGSIYAALFAAKGYEVIAYDPGLSMSMQSINMASQLIVRKVITSLTISKLPQFLQHTTIATCM